MVSADFIPCEKTAKESFHKQTLRCGRNYLLKARKEKTNRGDFFRKVATLPRWDGTKIWSPGLVLRPCQAQPERGRSKASIGKAESRGIGAFFEEPAAKRVQRPRGQFRVFSRFSFASRKPLWNRIHVPPGPKLRKPSWPVAFS